MLMNPAANRTSPVITVLVNWHRASDTIECLESLFASDYPDQHVVVVDNGSKDDSISKLTSWARNALVHQRELSTEEKLALVPQRRPVLFASITLSDVHRDLTLPSNDLVIINAKRNHGFAGGVNIGLRYAMHHRNFEYVWVLNNDTTVAPDCLSRMVHRMHGKNRLGMCGARILYYSQPDRVQVLGGARFSPWFGASHLIGSGSHVSETVDANEVERKIDHLAGASMLVSRLFLESVGLMDEGYFLYYEEADWSTRARGRFGFAYADDAIVFHKEGASIGSNDVPDRRSALSAYYLIRSRLRFTRRFYPWALPSVFAYSALVALRDLARGHGRQASAMLAALIGLSPERALGWQADQRT